MNVLMIAVLAVGAASLMTMRREVFPDFELEIILVNVPYPGATPAEVEEGVCQKIEEAVRSIDNVRKVTSVASEGGASVILELAQDVSDAQRVLNEVRSAIERIASFPELAEDPAVEQVTFRTAAINLGVKAPALPPTADAELRARSASMLRAVAEQIRDDLLAIPQISQATIEGAPDYQIDVEVAATTLQRHGLTLEQVAAAVRRENLDLPGGALRAEGDVYLLRGAGKQTDAKRLAAVPVIKQDDGAVLTVGELGRVVAGFADSDLLSEIDGRPGLGIAIERTAAEDLLAMTAAVHEYAAGAGLRRLPPGFELVVWGDRSVDVRDRQDLLLRNGQQGLLLVFLVLAVFLEIKLAFWVALGIPVAMLGAGGYLLYAGQTLNMLSMFAFLMALGIIVDDAIVVGENVYAHRLAGKDLQQAALDGTVEVAPSVVASVLTTVIAFGPLLFVAGVMGKFIAVMPVAVIAMLLISLVESMTALPSHLAHKQTLFFKAIDLVCFPLRPVVLLLGGVNRVASLMLEGFVTWVYLPLLRTALAAPMVTGSLTIALLLLAVGFVGSGLVPFIIFPKLDANEIVATIEFPDGTPLAVTAAATERIEQAIRDLDQQQRAQGAAPILRLTHRLVGQVPRRDGGGPSGTFIGAHRGQVLAELTPAGERALTSIELSQRWREAVGTIPGALTTKYGMRQMGPGGTPIEFKLLARAEHQDQLSQAVAIARAALVGYAGVFDIADDARPGKWELQLQVRDDAHASGVTLAQIARTLRDSYFGAEVQRLQLGRHEVKLMLRLPEAERRSLAVLEDMRLQGVDGQEWALADVARFTVVRGPSEINRIDQQRAITISADLDEALANASEIVNELRSGKPGASQPALLEQLHERCPDVSVRWEGQAEQTRESVNSLINGLVIAMLLMFALLTIEFRSYFQPLLILGIVPFGAIGAVLGHYLMGLPMTLFSLFGLVALTGVVVNDSIVLVDFINERVATMPLHDALLEAGQRRFRPVMLTSVTTVAGLLPILRETSFQAQILVPMATSLLFGLMASTALVLVLVPTFYLGYYHWTGLMQRLEGADRYGEHDQ
jgi:multidrug efflux pump subunit AcrB